MGSTVGVLVLMALLVALHVGVAHSEDVARACGRLNDRLHRARRPEPAGRPIELIAVDARRLRVRYRYPPRGLRFAKYEGLRCAYDAVLAEACRALGHEHLFDVLPPGSERDAERYRIELLLDDFGFHLDDAA
ncbi:hypothetical protein [Nocardioides sp. LS1]|uniref:hypothetical protein n=1 Tax=Nocardioides sp. LS1 TaxID=1027620 RepID=UPI000F6257F8|nr:hypothetical protein [Nocardioides sp. LS1]GCD92019.1 hypothetical protein NLS1_40250 [Nocardioides sp. LS1]